MACTRCGGETKYNYRLCWRCHVEHQVTTAYEHGYEEGYRAGRASVNLDGLNGHRLRQLVQLCHPDRHGGSQTATDITQWLLKLKG